MHIHLSGSPAEKPSHARLSLLEMAEPDARPCKPRCFGQLEAQILSPGSLSRGMPVSDSMCSSALVAMGRFNSTCTTDSANKLLSSGFVEQTCQPAVVPVEKQWHSADSVREAVPLCRQRMYTAVPQRAAAPVALGLPS